MPKAISIPRAKKAAAMRKPAVAAVQAAIDSLPPASGDWSVEGVPGLYVRVGARTKTFRLQRRIEGRLVVKVLGEMTVAAARREALRVWGKLKPPPVHGTLTLGQAWERYLDEKPLAEKTVQLYRYNAERYLAAWMGRSLAEIGEDRAGVRTLYQKLVREHGKAAGRQVMQMLSAVYRYFRRVEPELPECPTIAVDVASIKPRDWALSDEELRRWWTAVERLRSPVKRVWWMTALLTGARAGSIIALRWADVDLDRRIIHFRVAKGGRAYSVPMSDRIAGILAGYRARAWLPNEADWVFPSPVRPSEPLWAQVRNDKQGVPPPHRLRHTFRTRLVELGATPDQARLLLGHSLAGDVSRGYITPHLLVESLRPLANAVAERFAAVLGW